MFVKLQPAIYLPITFDAVPHFPKLHNPPPLQGKKV